jgi:hypothetical protein
LIYALDFIPQTTVVSIGGATLNTAGSNFTAGVTLLEVVSKNTTQISASGNGTPIVHQAVGYAVSLPYMCFVFRIAPTDLQFFCRAFEGGSNLGGLALLGISPNGSVFNAQVDLI